MKYFRTLVSLTLIFVIFQKCSKTASDSLIKYNNYINLKIGKYIIYRQDSTITYSFGKVFVTHSYLIKDSVADLFIDNSGRPAYKIFRLQFDSTTKKWNNINTFFYTPTANTMEYVENNLRYIKLINPVSEGHSWEGNSYLRESPYYSNHIILNWPYHYQDINATKKIGNLTFGNTITVVQYDTLQNKTFYPFGFSSYDKGYEIYADTVGLIYRSIFCWEYQPSLFIRNCKLVKTKPSGIGFDTTSINCNGWNVNCDSLRNVRGYQILCDTSVSSYYYNGYGITETIVSHN